MKTIEISKNLKNTVEKKNQKTDTNTVTRKDANKNSWGILGAYGGTVGVILLIVFAAIGM